jgi:predicted lactoylglutathione lyase
MQIFKWQNILHILYIMKRRVQKLIEKEVTLNLKKKPLIICLSQTHEILFTINIFVTNLLHSRY